MIVTKEAQFAAWCLLAVATIFAIAGVAGDILLYKIIAGGFLGGFFALSIIQAADKGDE